MGAVCILGLKYEERFRNSEVAVGCVSYGISRFVNGNLLERNLSQWWAIRGSLLRRLLTIGVCSVG